MQEEFKNESSNDANNVLADSSSFWMNADKSSVQNYLKENIEDMDEYTKKKQDIINRRLERFEKPNGVSSNLFMWTMLVMAILGLIAAWLSL